MRKDLILFFLLCSCSVNGYQLRPTHVRLRYSLDKPRTFHKSNNHFSKLKPLSFSHVATLDDAFVPATFTFPKYGLTLLLGCIVMLVGQSGPQGNSVLNFFKPMFTNMFSGSGVSTSSHKTVSASKVIGPSDWGTCSLEKVDNINDNHTLFKFRIAQHNALPSSGLGVGRKIILCTSNSKGSPVKEALYPISSPFSKSTFEVVMPSTETDSSSIFNSLSKLSLGDEIAFKLGKNSLNYSGSETPIQSLTMIASGTGIVPLIQLLRRLFTNSNYNIDRCELLWINSKKEDFILNGEVEKFEADYEDKFVCARVLDGAMESNDYELNQNMQDSLPGYEGGRVALLSAPEPLTTKFVEVLEQLQYPSSDVILLT